MKICILPHLKKSGAKELTIQLARWLMDHEVGFSLPEDDAKAIGIQGGSDNHDLFMNVDLVIVLGGDGAILRSARLMGDHQLPTVGVNLGQLGFLTEIGPNELFEHLPNILSKEYSVTDLPMIEATMVKDDVEFVFLRALNEIVIEKHESNQLAQLELAINGETFHQYNCDALIIATSTGSTAYSLSAGGPIVSREAKSMIITPVCPHSFFNRSIVLYADDVIEISPVKLNEQYCIFIDGQKRKCHLFDNMRLSVSPLSFKLVSIRENSFFRSIKTKLIK